jgi:hypothetical protein
MKDIVSEMSHGRVVVSGGNLNLSWQTYLGISAECTPQQEIGMTHEICFHEIKPVVFLWIPTAQKEIKFSMRGFRSTALDDQKLTYKEISELVCRSILQLGRVGTPSQETFKLITEQVIMNKCAFRFDVTPRDVRCFLRVPGGLVLAGENCFEFQQDAGLEFFFRPRCPVSIGAAIGDPVAVAQKRSWPDDPDTQNPNQL